MEQINENLFIAGKNCFNKKTLEVFSFQQEYLDVLRLIVKGISIPEEKYLIREKIEQSGILSAGIDSREQQNFTPDFVAFRIVLGNTCNLRCRNCFVLGREHNIEVMDIPMLEQIITKTFLFGKNRPLKYHLFGGEPTVMADLLKHAVVMIRSAVQSGIIIDPVITITTNGTLIDESFAEFFRENHVQIGVSVDGPRELNDVIRGEGIFEKAMKSFRLLERYGVERWFLVTPYSDVITQIPDLVNALQKEFCLKSITFNTPFEGNSLRWAVDGELLADMILDCHEQTNGTGLRIESAVSPVLYALSERVKRVYPCSIFGKEVMGSISPDGRISFCAQYWENDIFPDKFCSDYRLLGESVKFPACTSCVAEYICGGPCLVQYKKTGSIDQNKCKFYRHFLDKFLKDPERYIEKNQVDGLLP